MKDIAFVPLKNETIELAYSKICNNGKLITTIDNYTYLKIDDNFINYLFPLLKNNFALKPDYFGENGIGAHISIFYPEENIFYSTEYSEKLFKFEIQGLFSTILSNKIYYVLKVNSNELLDIRRKYKAPDKPCFKNYLVDFHITIAYIQL